MLLTISDKEKDFISLFNACQVALALNILEKSGQALEDEYGELSFEFNKLILTVAHISRLQYDALDSEVFDKKILMRSLLQSVGIDKIKELISQLRSGAKEDEELLNYLLLIKEMEEGEDVIH